MREDMLQLQRDSRQDKLVGLPLRTADKSDNEYTSL